MSTVKAKVQEDIKEAMKARDQHRLETLRGLLSELKKVEIDTRADLTDEQAMQVLQREIKKLRDAIDFAKNAGRDEMIEKNTAEVAIVQKYLPEQLSAEELKSLIGSLVAGGADSMGKIMGELNKTHKGKFEGKMASELAKGLLGS